MSDDPFSDVLRDARATHRPHELALLLGELLGEPITQGAVIFRFKRAFRNIPLRTLIEAGAWHRVSRGGMTDAEFDSLLSPYISGPTEIPR